MAFATLNLKPNDRQLRQFGAVCAAALPLLAWFWHGEQLVVMIAAGIGLLGALVGYLAPQALRKPFVWLTIITMPIGLIVSELAMLLIFCLAFLPMAIVFRLIGRDALRRHSSVPKKTFWQKRPSVTNIKQYFRQF